MATRSSCCSGAVIVFWLALASAVFVLRSIGPGGTSLVRRVALLRPDGDIARSINAETPQDAFPPSAHSSALATLAAQARADADEDHSRAKNSEMPQDASPSNARESSESRADKHSSEEVDSEPQGDDSAETLPSPPSSTEKSSKIPSLQTLKEWHGSALIGRDWPASKKLDVNLASCPHRRGLTGDVDEKRLQRVWPMLSVEETFAFLIAGGSITRFGDGEWKLQKWLREINKGMEAGSSRLQNKIRLVSTLGDSGGKHEMSVPGLHSQPLPFCVAMVPVHQKNTTDKMDDKGRKFHDGWRRHMDYFWRHWFPQGRYCTTSVTRPDHRTDLPTRFFWDQWRQVFRGRAVLFVGPTVSSKSGHPREQLAPHGVLQCAAYVVHVPAPREKAFKFHDNILARTLLAWHGLDGESSPALTADPKLRPIVAIVAGPAATVLTGELPCIGVPAIDLGHMNPYAEPPPKVPRAADCSATGPKIYGPPKWWRDPLEKRRRTENTS